MWRSWLIRVTSARVAGCIRGILARLWGLPDGRSAGTVAGDMVLELGVLGVLRGPGRGGCALYGKVGTDRHQHYFDFCRFLSAGRLSNVHNAHSVTVMATDAVASTPDE